MNPQGEHLTDVKFKKAFIAYDKGKYEKAAPELKDLAVQFAQTERGRRAGQLYLDILNVQKKFEQLRDESLYFSTKLSFDKTTKEEFFKIHEQAYFTVVQNLESLKKYNDAAQSYAEFTKKYPQSKLADKAQLNSIRCYQLALKFEEAVQASEVFLKTFPDASNKTDVLKNVIALYEAQAQLGPASDKLLKLAELEPAKKSIHLLAAADYKVLSNDWSKAYQIYSEIKQKFPQSAEGKTSWMRIQDLSEKNSGHEKLDKLYREIGDSGVQPHASIALTKLAKRRCADGEDEECFRAAKKVIAQRNEKDVSRWALAQARLLQGKILEKEFDLAGVEAKADRLGYVLKIKVEKLQRVQVAYQDVLSYKDKPTAIEALVKLAGVYAKFSQSLRAIEAPGELPEKEKEKFLAEIEKIVIPMEEKNADTLSLALKQARDMKLHDGTIFQIQNELNKLSKKMSGLNMASDIQSPVNVLPVVN
jgi:outer membrane protein assembly factor BamD (BamD/ComL family)